MSANHDLERRIAAHYAAEAPPRAPDWVLERILASVDTSPQRRTGFGLPWRFPPLTSSAKLALTSVAVVAVGLTALAVSAPRFGTGTDQTPSRFVGEWASIVYNDPFGDFDTIRAMTIEDGEDGVLRITVHDDSSNLCSDTATTIKGTGRLETETTLVVPSPILACDDGSAPSGEDPSGMEKATSTYTFVLDLSTGRLYDNREVVWRRGAPPESWAGPSTQAGADGPGTFAILHGEVTFRATAPWNDHAESYLDPRVFFLLGPGDGGVPDGDTAEMTILLNPLPREIPCPVRRVPPSAEELVQTIRSDPDLETTVPVTEPVGEIDAFRMDVVAAPGSSVGPCSASTVDVVSVPGRPWAGVPQGGHGRLYVLDLPGGSARTLAIWITAREAALFERALGAAAPVLDSFEFHTE